MVIEITIDEGQQYLVGDLRIQGNEIFSTQELLPETSDGPIERLGMNKGDLFTPAGLEENRSALEDLYESQGHLTPSKSRQHADWRIQDSQCRKGHYRHRL